MSLAIEKKIQLSNTKINYQLKISKRAKRARLKISHLGLTVTIPRLMSQTFVERFIIEKSKWILDKLNYVQSHRPVFIIKNTRANYLNNKDTAKLLAMQKVEQFNKIYRYRVNIIRIKNQKSRWGSCSEKGNLNFNYRIALLPERIVDYIIVHELCHLGEFNHSKKFWNLVAKTIPDYVDIRMELKKLRL